MGVLWEIMSVKQFMSVNACIYVWVSCGKDLTLVGIRGIAFGGTAGGGAQGDGRGSAAPGQKRDPGVGSNRRRSGARECKQKGCRGLPAAFCVYNVLFRSSVVFTLSPGADCWASVPLFRAWSRDVVGEL